MTNAQFSNLGRYALMALFGALVAAGLKLGQELAGTDPIAWRAIASVLVLSFCGALGTAAGASTLTRPGSEGIRAQVDALRARGVHRDDMVVSGPDQAVAVMAGNGDVEARPAGAATVEQIANGVMELSPKERAQLQAIVDRRHADLEAEQGASRG